MVETQRRAVVADKDEAARRAAIAVLDDFMDDISEVVRSEQLVKSVEARQPDLLLVDLGMVSAAQVKELRQKRPSMNVLMTYGAGRTGRLDADFDTLLEVGATDFLPKPYNRAQLLHRIRTLDAIKPFIGLASGSAAPAGRLLLGLHHHESGRLDASLVARFMGISLKTMAEALGRSYRAVHKTPHSVSLQSDLQILRRIVELLLSLVGSRQAACAWLNTPSPDLAGETPLGLIKSGRADSVRDLLENVASGAPA